MLASWFAPLLEYLGLTITELALIVLIIVVIVRGD